MRRDGAKKTLSAKKAVSLPGSGNDAIRAVQNLPGVARVPGLSSLIVIQGSAPGDTRYTIDGHEVPIIFHFGGFSSVIQPEALDHIDYLSAGYDPNFGRAQGGLIGAWTKKPDADRTKGFVFVDLLNAGGALETPLDDQSSLYAGLRKSYIGAILKAASKHSEDFNLTAAPSFDDASLVYSRKLGARDDFKFVTIGSRDTLEFLLDKPIGGDPALRGDFFSRTAFVRVIPEWKHRHSDGAISSASVGVGRDWIKFVAGSNYFNLVTDSLTVRAEHERNVARDLRIIGGMDHSLEWTNLGIRVPTFYDKGNVNNPLSTGDVQELNLHNARSHAYGAYLQGIYTGLPQWTLKPGLRFDYFETTKEFFIEPRASVRRELGPSFALRAASGFYAQPATPQESSREAGNPNIDSPRSFHLALGLEKDFRVQAAASDRADLASHGIVANSTSDGSIGPTGSGAITGTGDPRGADAAATVDGLTLTTGPFYRKFSRVVVPSTNLVERDGATVPERFNNSASGESYGMEVYLQGFYFPYTFSVSYTLGRSFRREPDFGRYPSGYDQIHNLNLIGSREIGRDWRVSSRFRYVSGNPITPVEGSVFDADNGVYIPVRGALYSSRVSPFWQLDVRFDKRWVFKSWILSAYFDIQNITNHRNVEDVQYAYDYRTREDVKGLPILPILGFKGEF